MTTPVGKEEIALYITLGSPHQYSIISVPTLQRFTKSAKVASKVPCVSVSGGIRDLQGSKSQKKNRKKIFKKKFEFFCHFGKSGQQ